MKTLVRRLHTALPSVKDWIDRTLQAHASSATSVLNVRFPHLQSHYPDTLLARAQVVIVPRVPFPPVSQLGLPEFSAMEMMSLAGVTYKDTFFVCNGSKEIVFIFTNSFTLSSGTVSVWTISYWPTR